MVKALAGRVNRKETLADKIADVLSTTPANLDPEDEFADETRAKSNRETVEDYEDDNEEILSKFRRQNVDLLADVDERYAGKKGSRKSLSAFHEDSGEEEQQSLSDDDNSSDGDQSEELVDEDESNLEESDQEKYSSEGSEQNEDDTLETETPVEFQHMKTVDVPQQMKKGLCVKNQLSIWENLLEMRIQIQKCLVAANKMPASEKFKEIRTELGPEFTNKASETVTAISTLLNKLLDLQTLVWSKYPETKKLTKTKNKEKVDDDPDNEEIPSDTEEEASEDEEDGDNESPRKKRKLSELETEITTKHAAYKDYRNNVIKKWYDKTTISIMKANASPYSVINNIEHTLGDKAKLIKRTQLKRSDYKILGEDEATESPHTNEDSASKPGEEYNSEIFDDDDFYHQLLRELIEVKSADITDPVQLGRQWIQLQNMRGKMKRKIDTKATKGRKIRYAVHTKLVNFMAPIDENLWTDESKTDLYSSLFGKNG